MQGGHASLKDIQGAMGFPVGIDKSKVAPHLVMTRECMCHLGRYDADLKHGPDRKLSESIWEMLLHHLASQFGVRVETWTVYNYARSKLCSN
jgi:hypothetical protein